MTWSDRLVGGQFPFPHDRFAIVDDELWHFGHTVGGCGDCLFAASGPWGAVETDAVAFYELVWDELARPQRK
jgi:hypothetical protein